MKFSKRARILFALHEPVDAAALGDLPRQLRGARIARLEGFDYDAAVRRGKVSSSGGAVRRGRASMALGQPRSAEDRIFRSVLHANLHSREAAVIFGQLDVECRRLARANASFRPDVVIVPEDFRLLHGGLASRFFAEQGIPSVAVPPLYHEWIAARSLMGAGTAAWTTRTDFLRRSLGASTQILRWSPPRSAPKRAPDPGPRIQGPFVLAALQNDDGEEAFLSLLADAFPSRAGSVRVIAKTHPSTSAKRRLQLRRKFPSIQFYSGEGFGPWIRRARAFLTVSSSSALIAVQRRLPVVFVNPGAFELAVGPVLRFHRFPPVVSRPDRLKDLVDRLGRRSFRAGRVRRQEILRRAFFSNQRPPLTGRALLSILSPSPK